MPDAFRHFLLQTFSKAHIVENGLPEYCSFAAKLFVMNIPVVDLNDFVNGSAEQKQAFVTALGKAYEEVGFVAVKNHGIADVLIRELYQQVQQFFKLLIEVKLQ